MSVLWPLLHYQQIQGSFNVQQWKNYVQVNETLAEEVARIYQKNDLIFVQGLFDRFLIRYS
jgi:trehalose-6-phosphate synthase